MNKIKRIGIGFIIVLLFLYLNVQYVVPKFWDFSTVRDVDYTSLIDMSIHKTYSDDVSVKLNLPDNGEINPEGKEFVIDNDEKNIDKIALQYPLIFITRNTVLNKQDKLYLTIKGHILKQLQYSLPDVLFNGLNTATNITLIPNFINNIQSSSSITGTATNKQILMITATLPNDIKYTIYNTLVKHTTNTSTIYIYILTAGGTKLTKTWLLTLLYDIKATINNNVNIIPLVFSSKNNVLYYNIKHLLGLKENLPIFVIIQDHEVKGIIAGNDRHLILKIVGKTCTLPHALRLIVDKQHLNIWMSLWANNNFINEIAAHNHYMFFYEPTATVMKYAPIDTDAVLDIQAITYANNLSNTHQSHESHMPAPKEPQPTPLWKTIYTSSDTLIMQYVKHNIALKGAGLTATVDDIYYISQKNQDGELSINTFVFVSKKLTPNLITADLLYYIPPAIVYSPMIIKQSDSNLATESVAQQASVSSATISYTKTTFNIFTFSTFVESVKNIVLKNAGFINIYQIEYLIEKLENKKNT